MAKIDVRCPVCSSWEKIDVSEDMTKNVKKGLLAINITAGMICEHSFICYVDKNLSVRDSLVADFKIEVAGEAENHMDQNIENVEIDSLKFDLIKMNISDSTMALIFRGIFLGKDIVLIYDDYFLADHIINFFNYVKNGMFEQNIITMSKSDYNDKWSEYTNHLVLEKAVILQNDNPLIDLKKMGIEKGIVKKFLREDDLVTGLIILRNEMKKAYEFSNNIAQFLNSSTINTWNPKILIDHIKDVYGEKIQKSYLTFLLVIVEHYFKVNIPTA
jgi:hypothetical protein